MGVGARCKDEEFERIMVFHHFFSVSVPRTFGDCKYFQNNNGIGKYYDIYDNAYMFCNIYDQNYTYTVTEMII